MLRQTVHTCSALIIMSMAPTLWSIFAATSRGSSSQFGGAVVVPFSWTSTFFFFGGLGERTGFEDEDDAIVGRKWKWNTDQDFDYDIYIDSWSNETDHVTDHVLRFERSWETGCQKQFSTVLLLQEWVSAAFLSIINNTKKKNNFSYAKLLSLLPINLPVLINVQKS